MKKSTMSVAVIGGIALLVAVVVGLLFWFDVFNIRKTEQVVKKEVVAERSADTLVIGLDPNYPPMEFMDANANMTGFDIDLIRAAMRRMNKPYDLLPIPWGAKTDMLNDNSIDLVWSGLNITDERKQIYELSQSYLKGEQIFIVSAISDIRTPNQLAFKRIGVPAGSFVTPMLEEMSNSNPDGKFEGIKEYSEAATAMTAVLTGEVSAAVVDGVAGRYYASNSPGKFRVLSEVLVETGGTAVAAKKGNTALINQVNTVLDQMHADGSLEEIRTKWFGQ